MSIEDEIGDPHQSERMRDEGGMMKSRSILRLLHPSSLRLHPSYCFVAYKQLNNEKLAQAIAMAETLLAGDTETLARWNRESLQWRGKLKSI